MRTKAWVIAAAIVCAAACSKSNGNSTAANGGSGSGGDTPTSPGYGGTTCDDPAGGGSTINANPCLDYNPTQITVTAGTTVTFAFGATAHTVTFTSTGAPANIPSTQNANATRTFATAGTYGFYCSIHPSMVGTIVVQ
jgi:plastocyanin